MNVRGLLPLTFLLAVSLRADDLGEARSLPAAHPNISPTQLNPTVESSTASTAARREAMESIHNSLSAGRKSPIPSLTPERDALVTGTELLSDGGFEGGYYGGIPTANTRGVTGPWTWFNSPAAPDPVWPNYMSDVAHTGSFFAYFNPFGESYSALYQTVTIPSGVTATFSFWLKILTNETPAGEYDTITVSITDWTGQTELSRLAVYSNLNSNGSYIKHTFDLSAFAGQTVMIAFNVHEDLSNPTMFELDDVSLLASSSSSGSCVEDAYTMCLVNGRYRVTSHWLNQYASAPAAATLSKTKLTDTVGAFWTADANTYEYLVRIQTSGGNGKAWVAVTTFTDVEFWVSVTDTVKNQLQVYHSTPGNRTLIYDPNTFVYP